MEEIQSIEKRKITSQILVDELLKNHDELKNAMKESYDDVSAEAKSLLKSYSVLPAEMRPIREKKKQNLGYLTTRRQHLTLWT